MEHHVAGIGLQMPLSVARLGLQAVRRVAGSNHVKWEIKDPEGKVCYQCHVRPCLPYSPLLARPCSVAYLAHSAIVPARPRH